MKYFEMDMTEKPVCQYGSKCYRRNEVHLQKYSHPTDNSDAKEKGTKEGKLEKKNEDSKTQKKGKIQSIESYFRKRVQSIKGNDSTEKGALPKTEINKRRRSSNKVTKPSRGKKLKKIGDEGTKKNTNDSDESDDDDNDDDTKSSSWTYIKMDKKVENRQQEPSIHDKLKGSTMEEIIKYYYLVQMPSDFYSFFKFCESINEANPLNVLKSFGLNLVGPFEILAGINVNLVDKELMLCHWRYFYDPPEFQTVLASESGFHIGYWRDSPQDFPEFVASNNATKDCSFKVEGENIFGAVHHYLTGFVKTCSPFIKTEIAKFQSNLSNWAHENEFCLEATTPKIKNRQKRINSKTFHGVGIVVPVEKKTKVGYRPLIETDASLKKICKLIMGADDEAQRETLMEKLQPLITFANIANDECDFGNSLELGIDLFCMGSPVFHNTIEHLLTTAYSLLNRREFSQIIKIHLKNRKKETCLSVL